MIDVWNLSHGQNGTTVELRRVPLWAFLACEAGERLLDAGHRVFFAPEWAFRIALAPAPSGEKPDEDGFIHNPHTLGGVLYRLASSLAGGFGAWRHYVTVDHLAVAPEWVAGHVPDAGWPWDGSSLDEARPVPGDAGDVQL